MTAAPLDLRSPASPDPDASAFAQQLLAELQAIAEDCDLAIDWHCEGTLMQLRFRGQEGAKGARIHQAWKDELSAAGLDGDGDLQLGRCRDVASQNRARQALGHCLRRIRTLLIEHNSYLSGGIPYPFTDAPPGTATRGLAQYRYPARAEVDLNPGPDRMQIAFTAGELGAITSSGFYLPTLFAGDLEVRCRYYIDRWQPCAEEAACFALFAQNESSSHRFYAQRMSTGTQGHRLLASMADQLQGDRAVEGLSGELRVRRCGAEMECAHRGPEQAWQVLGTAPAPPESELLVGAKIWSKLRCDGLCVTVEGLRIDGALAERQVPRLESRPDPRSDPRPGT